MMLVLLLTALLGVLKLGVFLTMPWWVVALPLFIWASVVVVLFVVSLVGLLMVLVFGGRSYR